MLRSAIEPPANEALRATNTDASARSKSAAKVIVFVGNCQTGDIRNAFAAITELHGDFEFHEVPLHVSAGPDENLRDLLSRSSLVVAQDTSGFAHRDLTGLIPPDTNILHIPFLSFRSLWPFDGLSYGNDPLLEAQSSRLGSVRFSDGLLGRLRTTIPDPELRFQAYRSLDLPFPVTNFERLFEIECDLLLDMDERYDMTLGRHIIANIRKRQLFYWTGHPVAEVYQVFVEQIWQRLKLPGKCPEVAGLDVWKALQAPVHPLVGRRLDIDWITEETVYHYAPLGHVTWETYIRNYIRT